MSQPAPVDPWASKTPTDPWASKTSTVPRPDPMASGGNLLGVPRKLSVDHAHGQPQQPVVTEDPWAQQR